MLSPLCFSSSKGRSAAGQGETLALPPRERGARRRRGEMFFVRFLLLRPGRALLQKEARFSPLKVSAVRRKLQKKTRDLFSLRIVSTSSSEKNSLVGKKEKKALTFPSLLLSPPPTFLFPPFPPPRRSPFPPAETSQTTVWGGYSYFPPLTVACAPREQQESVKRDTSLSR